MRKIFAFIAVGYAVGLAVYLSLRLVVSDGLWWLALLNMFAPYCFAPLAILFPLALALRQWRAVAALLPLVLIGMMWLMPYYLPKAHAAPSGATLRVVTFNIFPYNRQLEAVEAWLRRTNADVVLLQEIPRSYYGEDKAESLQDLYPYQVAQQPKFPGEGRIIEGLMVLSRAPLAVEDFTLGDEGSGLVQQRITLEVGGQTIALYNTHLLMPFGEEPRLKLPMFLGKLEFALRYDDTARNTQIARLLERLEGELFPYLVAGDFNLSDQSAIYGMLAARMGDSFREAGVGFGASWPSGESEELPDVLPPLLRLDYIWHSPQFRAVSAGLGPKLGSDHLPLVVTLEILP